MKAKILVLSAALAFATILLAQRPTPVPDSAIVFKLREIVTLRERIAKNHAILVEAGRAVGDFAADIELAEARIALAQETGQRDALLAAHKDIVAAHEQRLDRLSKLHNDRLAPSDLDRAKASLMEAQVRLLRSQK